jgi:hypothetical protein
MTTRTTPALAAFLLAGSALADDTRFFPFARVGNSYSAAVFSGDPDVGRRVVSAAITLRLTVSPGSDAAEFSTDLLLPIQADSGAAVVAYSGTDLGWSGAGSFEFTATTSEFNGVLIARRYGAETYGVAGSLSDDSGVTVVFESSCPADFNADGFADFFDYADYVGCFETGVCPPGTTADFNGDGFADFFDYADFVAAFETGC